MPDDAAIPGTTQIPPMSPPSAAPALAASAGRRGRPYGLVGLVLSIPLIFVVTAILILLAAGLVFAVAGLAMGWQEALAQFQQLRPSAANGKSGLERLGIVFSLVSYAALSTTVLAAARWRGGQAWRDVVGWHPPRALRVLWAVIPLTIVYGLAANALVSWLYPPSKDWITLPKAPLWVSLFILLAVVFAPITEELFFRGWLYTSLRSRLGMWTSIVSTSVLFALAHWERTHIYALAVFPVGLALAFVRERTGSLAASMTCHAAYNGAASVLLLFGF